MIDKNNKKRVMITLPKRQAEWITQFCKEHRITISHYISWMLTKKAEEMIKILQIDKNNYDDDEIRRILQTSWID